MSRLTELLNRVKSKDKQLGRELAEEFKVLSSRRQFGLNFERHKPENVELPNREVKKGDKVRMLPERGSTTKGDQRLWRVKTITKKKNKRIAIIELVDSAESERQEMNVADLIVVAEFQDYIYPGLVSTGKVERGGDKPHHTVINGENYHALKALTFTHKGKIDAIYIDPPYNSGARDWKYSNDYVESDDNYRHSKWLAFMERRLQLSKQLLNPKSSALIVTIDEKEYLRLGMLLEQVFPESKIQMVSSQINAKGIIRANELTRTNEFIFFILIGKQELVKEIQLGDKSKKVRWQTLRRGVESYRGSKKGGPAQFYPIYVNDETDKIEHIGTPLTPEKDYRKAPEMPDCTALFPIREKDGVETNWGLTVPALKERLANGYVKVFSSGKNKKKKTVYYLTSGQIEDIEKESMLVLGRDENGSAIVEYDVGKATMPTTQWAKVSHNAQSHGSDLIKAFLDGRSFPFPKSLHAVEDALRIVVGNNKNANILDFFSGSGTTAHAVMRLNKQDNGRRQCISVTNNEVSADEQIELRKKGLRQGDKDWEKWGICDYITKPRISTAITGKTPSGKDIKGDYKFTDEFPMSEGFKENVEFFTLNYHTPIAVNHNLAFNQIAPLLWMRAGSQGKRTDELPEAGWEVTHSYGLIIDLDKSSDFVKAIKASKTSNMVFIVTNDDRRFQAIVRQLPEVVEPVRLYESYLKNFQFTSE